MNKEILEKICKVVYRQFPPVKNVRPKVAKQGEDNYLLIFSGSGETPDGKTIRQKIRVVVTSDGQILKTSMSR